MDKKAAKEYACPMRCEGDKVYPKPGDCPVCNMHLVPADKMDKHAEHQRIAVQSEQDHKAEKKKISS
jgi:Cu+-exporting ATPase